MWTTGLIGKAQSAKKGHGDEGAYWKEYASEGDGETMHNDNRE